MDQQLVGQMAESHSGRAMRGILLRQGDAENRVRDFTPGVFAQRCSSDLFDATALRLSACALFCSTA